MSSQSDLPVLNWKGASDWSENSGLREPIENCFNRTNWAALCQYASSLHPENFACTFLSPTNNGANNLVRILEFEDKTRWIARILMKPSTPTEMGKLKTAIDTMTILKERTKCPVPTVFGYEIDSNNPVGVPFVLKEFLPGSTAMDADGGLIGGEISLQRRERFYDEVARVQVQMMSLRLPKIETVVRNADGSYDVGPIPGIGGPFETATAFFEAWGSYAKFPGSMESAEESLTRSMEFDERIDSDIVRRVLTSLVEFPGKVKELAGRLPSYDKGPFPLAHMDFFQSNIVIDESYGILGVIDWEGAHTVPWEMVIFPEFLDSLPVTLDFPWSYDGNGEPLDEDTKERWREQEEYVERVAKWEAVEVIDSMLSKTLGDKDLRELAGVLNRYEDGKLGIYGPALKPFEDGSRSQRK